MRAVKRITIERIVLQFVHISPHNHSHETLYLLSTHMSLEANSNSFLYTMSDSKSRNATTSMTKSRVFVELTQHLNQLKPVTSLGNQKMAYDQISNPTPSSNCSI
jgi:hypothetical protein